MFSAFRFFEPFDFFYKVILWTNLTILSPIWDYYQKKISKLSFLFSILSSIVSWNMCKSRRKLCNAKIYPPVVLILQFFFLSMSFYGQFREFFHIYEPQLSKQFFSKLEFLFSVLGSMMSKNMCKLRHKLKNPKNLPKLTSSWQNNPWL